MPKIPIPDAKAYAVPAVPAFDPDRLGVRRVAIDIDRRTDARRVSLTPCPATAEAWGPVDAAELVSPDLLAELLDAPDSDGKSAALKAVQRITDVLEADLPTVADFLLTLRG